MPVALGAIGLGVGLYQTIFSGKKKAERKFESALDSSPQYAGNKGVNDYYQETYNRYLASPQNSALYQNAVNGIGRNTANTLNFLQDRRDALDAVGQVEATQNQGTTNALIAAENQRNQRFGILGNATNMKAADDNSKFQINTMMPYQNKLNLLATKASNKTQQFNQGLSNIYNGLGSIGTYYANRDNPNGNTQQQNNSAYSPVNLNQLNGGGVSGNYNTLQSGNPFATSYSNYQNPYGE